MNAKARAASKTKVASNQPSAPVVAGKHRRSYHVAITQATQNGTTTVEEIRVLPTELYAPSRLARVHDASAYDTAIANLSRSKSGFQLTIDRGPSGFQIDLPPTLKEIAKVQDMLQTWRIDAALKETISRDLAKQAAAVALR
jgi:hypothetical protein